MTINNPEQLIAAQANPRWAAMVRLDATVDDVRTWDPGLLRERRILVPVDLQALVVPAGSREPFVRLPFALSSPDGEPLEAMPEPFAEGTPRPPGVHLHWAMPDALLRGELSEVSGGSANRLAMPALPDRWVVLRLLAGNRTSAIHVRGWVLDATTGRAVPLEQWPGGAAGHPATGKAVAPGELTGSVGGSLSWTGQYDAVRNRMAFHDPLDDLQNAVPQGSHNGLATYLVAGWWSEPGRDPLSGAQTTFSLHHRLNSLGWSLMTDAEGGDVGLLVSRVDALRRASLGLRTQSRYSPQETGRARREGASAAPAAPAQVFSQDEAVAVHHPGFFDDVASVVLAEPRWPRSTLLHATAFGVPVDGRVVLDQRPPARGVQVALGAHVDDVAGALVSRGLVGAAPQARRSLERVLSGFTGNLLDRVDTVDGLVDIEEHEHVGGFASFPGGPGTLERLRPAGESPAPGGPTRTATPARRRRIERRRVARAG